MPLWVVSSIASFDRWRYLRRVCALGIGLTYGFTSLLVSCVWPPAYVASPPIPRLRLTTMPPPDVVGRLAPPLAPMRITSQECVELIAFFTSLSSDYMSAWTQVSKALESILEEQPNVSATPQEAC